VLTVDELAGVVDLFGALTRSELESALSELAYRRGADADPGVVDDALSAFALVAYEDEGQTLLTPGPTAFPELVDGAEDLPHILDVEPRAVDRAAVGRAAERRLRAEAAQAVASGDADRAETLLDVSYDLEAWAPLDLGSVRDRLDATREPDSTD
jgi:hypothetical protein